MKNKGYLSVGVVALIIGLLLSMQIKNIQGNYTGGLVPFQKAQGIANELKKVRAEKNILAEELANLEAKIKEIEDSEASEDILFRNIASELEKYKMLAGVTTVEGPGVLVTIDDPPQEDTFFNDASVIMYNYDLLLLLINKLKDAGAEAISINEQRIIAITEINLAGSNVNINSVPTAPPFIIKAIGNPDTMEATLNIRFGIVDQMTNRYNLQVLVEKEDDIVIPRYNDILKFRYAMPVE